MDDIISFCRDIIDNFTSIINKVGEIKHFSTEKKRSSQFSSSGKEKIDKYGIEVFTVKPFKRSFKTRTSPTIS